MARVDLITGFLGAGKTTFIRGYARWLEKQNIKFAVIENEFGAAGVDTALLQNYGMEVVELAGGCICCTMKVGFAYALKTLAEQFERIIVEPSGIFGVEDFFDVMNGVEVREVCELGALAVIVDPHSIDTMEREEAKEEAMLFYAQINAAGSVLVSKTELAGPEQTEAAVRKIRSCLAFSGAGADDSGNTIPIITKSWSDLSDADYEQISGAIPAQEAQNRRTDPAEKITNHQMLFNSTAIYPQKAYSEEQLRAVLGEILSGVCGRVIRIKGVLECTEGGILLANCSPGAVLVERSKIVELKPMLNVIGKNINRKEIARLLG